MRMELRNRTQHFLSFVVVPPLHYDLPAKLLVRQECASFLVFKLRVCLVYDIIGMGYKCSINH